MIKEKMFMPLSAVALVRVSGVDKKSFDDETVVRLCNYTDVYKNPFIGNVLNLPYMVATANDREIEAFTIKEGQVAITKDSEKADDIGIPSYIAETDEDIVLGYHLALITPHEGVLDGKYLNYYLQSPHIKKYFEKNASGSGQRYFLSQSCLDSIPMTMPKYDTQVNIGKLLHSLDRKIVVNNNIIIELEKTAKLLYDYWFVQFDYPNIDGNPYRTSDGKMEYNDTIKCEVPQNWHVEKLFNYLTIDNESFNPMDHNNTIVEHYSIPAYDEKRYPVFEAADKIGSTKYRITNESILVSKLNPKFRRIWDPPCISSCPVCSTEFIPFKCKNVNLRPFIYAMIGSDRFHKLLCANASSSTGSRSRVTPEDTLEFMFPVPEMSLIEKFSLIYEPILERIRFIRNEIQELNTLRDYLLPLLMNGQVRVESVESKLRHS